MDDDRRWSWHGGWTCVVPRMIWMDFKDGELWAEQISSLSDKADVGCQRFSEKTLGVYDFRPMVPKYLQHTTKLKNKTSQQIII